MLVLSRRIGETLVIGDNTFCTVLGVKGNQVRFGINAPLDISVHRKEIFLKIAAERKAAAGKEERKERGLSDLSDLLKSYPVRSNTASLTH